MRYTRPAALAAIVAIALLWPVAGHASPEGDRLARCLADNTTGKERKDLARWIFVSMAAHPEIAPLSTVTPAQVEDSSRVMGRMVTVLLVDRCPAQASAALQVGTAALEQAFSALGELAMGELISEPGVEARLGAFERYLDGKRLAELDAR